VFYFVIWLITVYPRLFYLLCDTARPIFNKNVFVLVLQAAAMYSKVIAPVAGSCARGQVFDRTLVTTSSERQCFCSW